ncbi:MAG: hypothetical protein JSW73_01470 [Candidatus Woesearchaeota archaeon]|nr:MAG: hypothetical protein JSW73_01470 [Candidatus Woesearchaeota archaeon]
MVDTLEDIVDKPKTSRKKALKVVASIGVATGIFAVLFYSYLNSGHAETDNIPPQLYPLVGYTAGLFSITIASLYKNVLKN